MKYSFMSFSCPKATLDEMLDIAKRFGYDAIEPRIGIGHAHGVELELSPEQRAQVRQKAEASGITIGCIACSAKYTNAAELARQIEDTKRCIDLAADVGAARLRVFGGEVKADASPEAVEAAVEQVADALRQVADHAQERGVVVCVESHTGFADPERMAEVMRRANHPAIAVNWDVLHPLRLAGASIDAAFQTLQPWILYVHIHDGLNHPGKPVILPIGEGDVDHRRVLQLLQSMNYDGYLSLEWEAEEGWQTHLPREIETMKRYEAELSI